MKGFFKALLYRPITLISLVILVLLYLMMIFAEFVSPYTPTQSFSDKSFHPPSVSWYSPELGLGPQVQERAVINEINWKYARIKGTNQRIRFFVKGAPYKMWGIIPGDRHLFGLPPGEDLPIFLMGSDNLGRDLFTRILYGSRISLTIGFIGIAISMTLAITFGGLAGFYGGKIDWFIMRFSEFFILIPGLYLILFLRSILSRSMTSGQSFMVITVILSFVGWPGSARLIRGMVHSIKREDYISNAILEGIPTLSIIFKQIIPQMSSIIIVSIALGIPGFILGETVLSYLGLGIVDPAVSWGSLINREISTLSNLRNFPWFLIPGLFLLITTLAYNFLGDLLRDYLDPYHQGKGGLR
ncbi:ABC transporter permease [Oceanispirochaeta crateris]|uniref:ABC transporter permease n=1 Tax=Oceanispirochaeta crateris TaxID=2518645 RepID=UPI001FE882D0|nr:ABC transporter permease [Oceanispirochaeta crateris]